MVLAAALGMMNTELSGEMITNIRNDVRKRLLDDPRMKLLWIKEYKKNLEKVANKLNEKVIEVSDTQMETEWMEEVNTAALVEGERPKFMTPIHVMVGPGTGQTHHRYDTGYGTIPGIRNKHGGAIRGSIQSTGCGVAWTQPKEKGPSNINGICRIAFWHSGENTK